MLLLISYHVCHLFSFLFSTSGVLKDGGFVWLFGSVWMGGIAYGGCMAGVKEDFGGNGAHWLRSWLLIHDVGRCIRHWIAH